MFKTRIKGEEGLWTYTRRTEENIYIFRKNERIIAIDNNFNIISKY